MTFAELLDHALALLQCHGRVTYQTFQLQFHLDEAHLAALKDQLLYAHPQVIDDGGRGLVWTAERPAPKPKGQRNTEAERRFHALLLAVSGLLQGKRRVTYRTLKYVFDFNEALLEDIKEELLFTGVARDEEGKGLVWRGETPTLFPPAVDDPRPPATADVTAVPSPPMPAPPPLGTPAATSTNGPTASPEASPIEVPQDKASVAPVPTRNAPEAERRQLTVMFCDLADSTKLSQQLDPEDLREVVRAYQAMAAEVIHQYEGHLAQYLGDGLLIYFGWPVAHEDDAQRAAHAGLDVCFINALPVVT